MMIATLITARLKSTRLPKKVLRPLAGRPMIEHLVERLRQSELSKRVILCTSPAAQDDPLATWGEAHAVDVFRGDPEDVLLRLTNAARANDLDTVVSCTADNPFVDPEYIDRLVAFHRERGFDYSRSEGLPFGTFAYVLSVEAMERACDLKAESDTEVWGEYFTETGEFSCGVMEVTDAAVRWPELRLTVDTQEDFDLAERIVIELEGLGRVPTLAEIVALCRDHPELVAMNAHVLQRPGKPIVVKGRNR